MEKIYDIIIIGAGPAGLTAGLYSVRSGLKTAIASRDIGGTAASIVKLENWPGFKGSGSELIKKIYRQLKKFDVDFILEDVSRIEKKEEVFYIETKKKKLQGKAIILTTGKERKKIGVAGEEKFTGKGVSYCTTCDAFFFKNKTVAVIGGSDCAASSALELAGIAKKVYILKGKQQKCESAALKKIRKKGNIEIIPNAVLREIKGKEKVESILITEGGEEKEIKIDGIFIETGSVPLAEFARDLNLNLDKNSHIIVDEDMGTSVPGVFAAGDVTNTKVKQVLTSAAQGAIAARSAGDWLKNR